jgi:DNA-binding FadR family transcriptional regulator
VGEPLYRRAQAQLKDYIAAHGLRAGDALPSEAQLAAEFGMSRASMREAVKGLETLGILRTRHGGRVCVAEFSFAPILENLPYSFQFGPKDLRNLLELRESLEEGLIPKALRAARPADLRELDILAAAMGEPAVDEEAFERLDRAFHRRLFATLDNPLVPQMIDLFWDIFHRLSHDWERPVPDTRHTAGLHVAIVDALRDGDEQDSVRAMTEHFADVRDWVEKIYATDNLGLDLHLDQHQRIPEGS